MPEPSPEAGATLVERDASKSVEAPASTFTIVARTPTGVPKRPSRDIGNPLALVQRLPNGGLVVAAEYARARAEGAGPLTVELLSRGIESDIRDRRAIVQGIEGRRWVWADAAAGLLVFEEETSRIGPLMESYKLGANGFETPRANVGFWSAVVRDGSVLALERATYEVPNSSIYPKDSEYYQNTWSLKPARVAVLSGKAAPPAIPAGVCPTNMAAGPDGTVAIAIEKCDASSNKQHVGILRYPPGVTQAKAEWLEVRDTPQGDTDEVTVAVGQSAEIHVGYGDRLESWNGKEWVRSSPFQRGAVASLSRAPDGSLWAITKDRDGRGGVVQRRADGTEWRSVPLPMAPADRLDDRFYAMPTFEVSDFIKVDAPPNDQSLRNDGPAPLSAQTVDAAGDDVLVLASAGTEGFVLSTRSRGQVARLPSLALQRARLLQTIPPRIARSPKECRSKSYLLLPESTSVDAIREALTKQPATERTPAKVGEMIVEGNKRTVVFGDVIGPVEKVLAKLSPKRACGPAVIEREL